MEKEKRKNSNLVEQALNIIEDNLKNKYIELANLIYMNLRDEFSRDYVSGNLLKTMKIKISENTIAIEIPAPRYNMKKFMRTGIVQHYPNAGSYASELDYKGGIRYIDGRRVKTGEHKDYIDRAVDAALRVWCSKYDLSIKEK